MVPRNAQADIALLLTEFPAVGLLGPRQVGKTTLADAVAATFQPTPIYLDLETPSDAAKLHDAEGYFDRHPGTLFILDEIQRQPGLFNVLRGVIDRRRRQGFRTGQFLVLGSASLELLKQSSESLAGRIAYKELSGFNALEVTPNTPDALERLWLRGGFPDSYLADSDEASLRWRMNFVSTYLERDVPQLGPRIPAVTLRRLWTMLAHSQGGILNMSTLGAGLGVSVPTASRYVDLLEDLLLVRSLRPWTGNLGKRLVKSPKLYIRDSGLTHTLLNLTTLDDVLGHPVAGPSWEAFVLENIMSCLTTGASAWFYRTAAGAEVDVVLELGGQRIYAIEIKRSRVPSVSKGFYTGCDDIGATKRYVVYPGQERYPLGHDTVATSLPALMQELRQL